MSLSVIECHRVSKCHGNVRQIISVLNIGSKVSNPARKMNAISNTKTKKHKLTCVAFFRVIKFIFNKMFGSLSQNPNVGKIYYFSSGGTMRTGICA